MTGQQRKAEIFRDLHQGDGAFIIANPWDAGSARLLEGLGFAALASTSAGFAQTLGRRDGRVSLAEKLAHVEALCGAVSVPVSVDLENGFGHSAEDVASAITAVAGAGAVGASIEDYDGSGIYDFDQAVARVEAAVAAARALDFPFTLTARAENLLRGVDDPEDTIRRLQAFEAAGADVLYAPGIDSLALLRRVCASVSRPVNVLAPTLPGASLAELADAGARRVSVGGALALLAMGPVLEAGREMLEHGTFGWMSQLRQAAEAAKFLSKE
ncbi:MAG: isocitrate lyase/phosphoenolpyruvate mutase family protein [Gammaproteobacteria bacterium]|nr:isocitrate lyase/phosphoenolpyruvate mutase family protein [Gammaproteobacteria bacterium]